MKKGHEKCVRSSATGCWATLGLAMMALWLAPVAKAQSAAGAAAPASSQAASSSAAKPQASGSGQATTPASGAAAQANGSSQNTPEMVDLSAAPTDSLADAARKARAQKTKAAAPKVYTEDSVSRLSGHGVSVVGDGSGAGSGNYGEGGDASFSDGGNAAPAAAANSEEYWRGKARAIHDRMGQIDAQISSIQADIAKNGAVQIDPQSGVQAGVIYVKDRNEQIRQLQAQKDAMQNQLDALEDEGRKAGADSGWFR